ncbi:MAG: hypothetical protein ACFCU9_13180 [Cyanophyceae cyanobacterium]
MTPEQENQLFERIDKLAETTEILTTDLKEQAKKWDERFFQLSRDSINFARTVIITAAVVAVITPFLREGLELVASYFSK